MKTGSAETGKTKISERTINNTGTYTYDGAGTVNTHWIETAESLIVIDVQRDLTHAAEALAAVKKVGKPVAAVLITHGHPDHYAGIGVFKKEFPGLSVYASPVTAQTMREDSYGFNKYAREELGDFPDEVEIPDRIFADGAMLEIGGVQIITREMGQAEANSATVYYLPETGDIYFGDLVLNEMHGFYLEKKSGQLLAALDRLSVLFPNASTGHPGHGANGQAHEMIERMRDYTVKARALVAAELAANGATDANQKRVVEELKKLFPNYERPAGQPDMIDLSVSGLFEELKLAEYAPAK